MLEGPHHGFHVCGVHGLVVVFEVDPPGLTGDRLLPLFGVAQHRLAALGVEAVDAVFDDFGLAGDWELLLGLHLGGQAVAVPTEAAVDPSTPHGLIPRDDVLDVSSQQVAVVGEAVGEWGTVVEDVFPVGGPGVDRGPEGAVGCPAGENAVLDGWKIGPSHLRVGGGAHD